MKPRLQWLWKQKYRFDRGYQVASLINMLLLLLQSERLAAYLGIGIKSMVLIAPPLIFCMVWLIGYLISLPMVQEAEDGASSEVSPVRRDIGEILRILKEKETMK